VTDTSARPWLAQYAPGVPADIELTDQTLCELLDDAVARFGASAALDFFGSVTTYAELAAEVERGAAVLRDLGVVAGDRVALVLPNCPQHVVAFYATLRLGAIVVEHNPLYTEDELTTQFIDHGARIAVAWDTVVPTLVRMQPATELQTIVAVDLTRALPLTKRVALRLPVPKARATRAAMTLRTRDVPSWDALAKRSDPLPSDHPRPRADDIAALQYTGGTTGTPKGAMLTHRNLRANAAQGRAWVPGLMDGEEVVYGLLPFFHAYGLTFCLTFAMSIGATLVLFPRFDAGQVLEAMQRRPATFLPGVPPMYRGLAHSARSNGVDMSSVRFAFSGAMPLPVSIVEDWEALTGGMLVEGYGMTETSPITVGNPLAATRRPGTIGVPFPSTEVRVVDPSDRAMEVEPGDPGELLVRGPQVFLGYWRQPQETAEVLTDDGWMHTGDIVLVDDDGFITVIDRIKELIITGGFNVYPSQVEDALRLVPGVADAAAVGVPGRDGSERVVAAVVAEPGTSLDPDEIRTAVREHLTAYKVPRQVIVVDELPRSLIGKVLRRQVRDELLNRSDQP
jgi:long-chain acyl-CoA synthetase